MTTMTFPGTASLNSDFWERLRSPLISVALHGGIVLALYAHSMVSLPRYGVDRSSGTVIVDLIAAPAGAAPVRRTVAVAPDAGISTKSKSAPEARAAGDGAADATGTDETSARAGQSATVAAAPDYLRNPAPQYPLRARVLGQEGVVSIRVAVGPDGAVRDSALALSSGFPLLDEAALKAVRGWSFQPARASGVAIEATIIVPVRFKLEG